MPWKKEKSRSTKYNQTSRARELVAESGQTMVEVMVAVGLLGLMLVALYGGFSSSFAVVRVARENLRATQVLEERMEVLRLIKWSDVTNSSGFIPTNFTAPFFTSQPTNAPSESGFYYTGTVTIANAPLSETYSNSVRMIQIGLRWSSGNIMRQRQMTSFVSQYGMQNYIY